MSDVNSTDVAREQRLRRLAWMDFNLAPKSVIYKELGLEDLRETRQKIVKMRKDPIYMEAAQELRDEWDKQMMSLPGTSNLRKQVSHAFSICMKRLTELVSDEKVPYRELVNASRLIAQMDGRFLGLNATGDSGDRTENVGEELKGALASLEKAKTDKVQ